MAQTSYSFKTAKGIAGGIYDLSVHTIATRRNEEETGKMTFGVGVVKGTTAGQQVKLPASGAQAADFDGIVINGGTTEENMAGEINVLKDVALGVMKLGHVWVKLSDEAVPAYGAKAYLVPDGKQAGFFTDKSSAYSAYEKVASTETGALKVVASGASTGEINLASVTPCVKGYTPAVNDYVLSVEQHGAGLDVGVKFLNAADVENGIAAVEI